MIDVLAGAGLELLNVEFITTPNAGVNAVLAAATVGKFTSTPEPASDVLLLAGLVAMAVRGFRRRRLTA